MGETPSAWAPGVRGVSAGAAVLMAAFALEYVAVGAAMPTIAQALDGYAYYTMAFGASVAASVVGMVLGGWVCDRRGPRPVVVVGAAVFAVGLLVSGLAPTFLTMCLGRALQGFGTGATNVGIYVCIARAVPEAVRPRVFSVLAAAWVIPGLVGPLFTGWVVSAASWRWVFLGIVPFVGAGLAVMRPTLRRVVGGDEATTMPPSTVVWTLLAASAVGVLNLAGDSVDGAEWVVGGAMLLLLVAAARALLPAGTLRLRRGIPALMGVRGGLGGSFVSAEAFLPLILRDQHGYGPVAAGAVLAAGAVTWTVGSSIQGRLRDSVDRHRLMMGGAALYAASMCVVLAAVAGEWPGWSVVGLYGVAILGVGLAYPTATVVTMRLSDPSRIGANSSALQLSAALASAFTLAVAGVVFGVFYAQERQAAFAGILVVSIVAAVCALAGAARSRPTPSS